MRFKSSQAAEVRVEGYLSITKWAPMRLRPGDPIITSFSPAIHGHLRPSHRRNIVARCPRRRRDAPIVEVEKQPGVAHDYSSCPGGGSAEGRRSSSCYRIFEYESPTSPP